MAWKVTHPNYMYYLYTEFGGMEDQAGYTTGELCWPQRSGLHIHSGKRVRRCAPECQPHSGFAHACAQQDP